jgi:ribosomal protein S18 acetylase RimI-like enzyme
MLLTISPATPEDRPAACRVLFAHAAFAAAAAARLEALFAAGDLDPAGLVVAKDGDAVRGAMFAYRLGGGLAAVWLPVADDDATRDALVAGALAWVRTEPTGIIQAVVRQPEMPRTPPLVRAGFRHVTRLSFLTRDLSPPPPKPRTALRFVPVAEPTPAFADLLVRTYDGSLDVPELNGRRAGADILAGYLADTADRPPRWWRIDRDGDPVGVLLLATTDDPATTELTYLGVLPPHRGRGYGRQALEFVLTEVAATNGRTVALSVDVRNEPALRLYRGKNFRESDLREVFLCIPDGHRAK